MGKSCVRKHETASLLQIERHGVTIVFEGVPIERIGDVLDRVLHDLGWLEKMHSLAPHEVHPTTGGYNPLEVPEDDDDTESGGPVIGFTPTVKP